jgi:hypothetical protein
LSTQKERKDIKDEAGNRMHLSKMRFWKKLLLFSFSCLFIQMFLEVLSHFLTFSPLVLQFLKNFNVSFSPYFLSIQTSLPFSPLCVSFPSDDRHWNIGLDQQIRLCQKISSGFSKYSISE